MEKRALVFIIVFAVIVFLMGLLMPRSILTASDIKCEWFFKSISVGKWGNGNPKAGIWVYGAFPINMPGVTERPDWYVNGKAVGKAQIHLTYEHRWIPNSSIHLRQGKNTVSFKFFKEPCAGYTRICTFDFTGWDTVRPGGYKYFNCK